MTIPDESVWQRVEQIAAELEVLNPTEAARRVEKLQADGEPASVLSLVLGWLSLTAPTPMLGEGDVVGGRYTLRSKLGEGGMGTVWRATQQMIARDVAVKIIHPTLAAPALTERFAHEMEILGQLEHPGIVRIFDAGVHEHDGTATPFFAMECVEGVPLSQWAAARRADRAALLRAMSEVCTSVQYAHDRRIVHRDLKPSNIMVRPNGQPVVLDFGIARLAGGGAGEAGLFSGTPHYAAPEQHLGRDRDFRSGESVDVYAAGAILFEVLAGRRLFEFPRGTPISEMRRRVVEGPPPRLAEVLADCPPVLDEITARAVRRDPADRYFSIALLSRALTRASNRLYGPPQPPGPAWVPAAGMTVPETNWLLTEKLGEGSTGQVWLATHETLGERRVFKFCDSEEKVRTLKRELSLFRLLKERVGRNPHFITLHEVALEEPPWYLMMEHVEAQELATWCEQQAGGLEGMALEVKLELIAQAAEALQAAHEAGILHRDIKPDNLLVRSVPRSGEGPSAASTTASPPPHVYIADFGIGQIIADELQREGTMTGFTFTLAEVRRSTLSGTMLYLAPEVLEGHPASARSDLYSLGVVLWQLLVGNFHAALDPVNWPTRIADPLLRQDVERCLAGAPERRWPSAGDLAASLRALPTRREAEAQRQAEITARERAAYRRGVARAAAVAAAIVLVVATLAALAWAQREEARSARARGALQQARNVLFLENKAGRRQQGLNLLQEAGRLPETAVLIRSVAAGLLSLTDLVPTSPVAVPVPLQPATGETVRVASPDGALFATGHDTDGLQGTVTLIEASTGKVLAKLERRDFPQVPVPEPGFVQFSPDGKLLAVAGPKTSLQILLCHTEDATLHSYIFPRDDVRCFAWHRGSRLLATGGENRMVRIWDVASARHSPALVAKTNDFDLPPKLTDPAIDVPLLTLSGWRDTICAIAFASDGTWLAVLDEGGWLRIYSGFTPEGLPALPPPPAAADFAGSGLAVEPPLLLEVKLERSGCGRLDFVGDKLMVTHPRASPLAFALEPGQVFRERWLASDLRRVALSSDGTQLCAISDTDIFWLDRASLRPSCIDRGKNPAGVAFEPTTGRWVLPAGKSFLVREPSGPNASVALEKRPLFAASDHQGFQFGMAAANDRIAIYFGRRLQFFRGGKFEGQERSIVTGTEDGAFRDLLWDRQGTLATVVYATAAGLRGESYTTGPGPIARAAWTLESRGLRLIAEGDGRHLIERSTERGLTRLDGPTGALQLLDASDEARQDAPFAISSDGTWIAAVANRNEIHLIHADTGAPYADLPVPRNTTVTFLAWHRSGEWLAGVTEDGYLQVWSLAPWKAWLESHGLHP
jgi:serine/threonine protein kinase/WD40 repeat protein